MALSPVSDREALSSTALKENKYKWLGISEITDIPQTKLMDQALELLIKKYEKEGKIVTYEIINIVKEKIKKKKKK